MDFEVFLSPEALSDLQRIVIYIARENAVAAEKMGNRLLDAALSLRTFPKRGRIVPEFQRLDLREIVFRSYRIIYRVSSENRCVEIARFWHGARGFPHIPRGRPAGA
jgi:toxin ParE1/3/4